MQEQAEQWLKDSLGDEASFRAGQWEAIDALVSQQERVLVVQRTGWGKSLVYFMATRLQRTQKSRCYIADKPLAIFDAKPDSIRRSMGTESLYPQ